MKRKFTLLAAALMLLAFITPPSRAVGQNRTTITLFEETFDVCEGSGGNDGTWSGISGGTTPPISGWTFSKAYGAYHCVRFGTKNNKGSAETPAITITGDATLTFKAGAWNASGENTTLLLSATGCDLSATSVTMNKGAFNEYTINITEVTSTVKIKFEGYEESQSRFFLDEVKVTQDISTDPTCTVDPESWNFGEMQAGSAIRTKTFTVTTANLEHGLDVHLLYGTYYSTNVSGINSSATSTDITITLDPTAVGAMEDMLVIEGDDFDDPITVNLTATGLCNAPANALAYTSPVNLPLSGASVSTTLEPTANTGNGGTITYELTTNPSGAGFMNGSTFSATATGTYVVRATQALNGTTCGGIADITINVVGTDPMCEITPDTYEFGTVITGSTQSATFTVNTANLTGALTVTIDNMDKGFSVSPTSIAQNAVSTTVTVTYAPASAHAEVYASLSITGDGLASATEAVITGAAIDGYTVTFDAGTGTCTTTEMTGLLPGAVIALPEASTVSAPEGWTFAGWCATNVSTATTTQPTLLTDSYTVAGNATIYAVYSKTEAVETSFVFKDIAAANSWTNGTAYTTVVINPITLNANGGGNNGKYYTSDQTWRMYNGGSVSITTTTGSVTSVTSNPSKTFTISGGSASLSLTSQVNFKSITVNSSSTTYHTSPIGKVATPTIEVAGVSTGAANTYYETATVTLNCTTAEAAIYYTTDGNEPTTSSTLYEGPFAVTTTSTIKAIAVKAGYDNSAITSPVTITIVQPNVATFTNGVYSSLSTQAEFNTWNKYSVTGDQMWAWQSSAARMSGYVNNVSYDNEDWLITPKMLVENGKLFMTFQCAGAYGNADMLVAKYSTNYPGYGNPADYTWTTVTTDPTLPYNGTTSSFSNISCVVSGLANNTNVCFAIIYTSSTTKAGTALVKTFTAKQCYPVTYNSNGGTGDMTDSNSPYAVGATVTTLANDFTAPEEGLVFDKWSDGTNNYAEGATFNMPNAAVVLSAQWKAPCTVTATMAATEGEAVYDYNGGDKRYNISMSSSVSALGGCDITEYGFVYSTSETTPTLENATKLAVGTEYTEANTTFNAVIENTTGTYYVRAFATNEAGTAYSESAATVVVPGTYPTWTISYSTNGVAESTTHIVYQGETIGELLAEPTTAYVPDGFTFKGWYAEEYYNASTAPTYVAVGDAITGNMTLKAVFAKETTIETEQNLEITINNFNEITTSYTTLFTHVYNEATVQAYGVYKNANGIQMNNGKGTYIKNTTSMPGYITKFVMTWTATGKNSPTMYANANSVASTSSTNLGTQSNTEITQTIIITDPSTANYRYFYFDGTTVTGACYMSSFKIFYMGTTTTTSNYCTRVYTKEIAGYDSGTDKWYLIASPVAGSLVPTSVVNLVGKQIQTEPTVLYDFDLYRYNSQADKEWENYNNATHHDGFVLENGKGYLYAHKTNVTLSFPGMTYSGNGEVTMANVGWNLVGNPYGVTATVPANINFYRMNNEGDEIVEGSGSIAPMEGIFVYAESENDKVSFSLPEGNAAPNSNPSVVMNVTQNRSNVIDRAVVRFSEGSNLPKFQLFDHSPKLCIQQGTEEYAVVRSNGQGEMPVNFRANENGQYTLTVNAENVEMNYLHLIDNMTGADIDLLQTPSYTFNAKTTDYESRFRLVFAANNNPSTSSATDESFTFYSNGNWVISNEGEATLQVIDVTGRILSSEEINGTVSKSINAPAGMYVLRLINGDSVRTQKIVVR